MTKKKKFGWGPVWPDSCLLINTFERQISKFYTLLLSAIFQQMQAQKIKKIS